MQTKQLNYRCPVDVMDPYLVNDFIFQRRNTPVLLWGQALEPALPRMDNEMCHRRSCRNQSDKVAEVLIRVEVIDTNTALDGDGDLDADFNHFLDDVDDSLGGLHEYGTECTLLHPWTRAPHYYITK